MCLKNKTKLINDICLFIGAVHVHVNAWVRVCALFGGQRQLVGASSLLLPRGSQDSSPGHDDR